MTGARDDAGGLQIGGLDGGLDGGFQVGGLDVGGLQVGETVGGKLGGALLGACACSAKIINIITKNNNIIPKINKTALEDFIYYNK